MSWSARHRGVALLVVVATGCTSVGVTRLRGAGAPKPEYCSLDIYTSASTVPQPFEEACLLDSRTGSTAFHDKTVHGAIEAARPAACGCGADGLIVEAAQTEGVTGFGWGSGAAIIKAIRYKEPSSSQARAGTASTAGPANP